MKSRQIFEPISMHFQLPPVRQAFRLARIVLRPCYSSLSISCALLLATYGCTPSHSTSTLNPVHSAGSTQTSPIPGAPSGVTAFVGVSVVPMDEERVLSNYTVLIREGRIAELGPVAKVQIPKGATRIDAKGQYMIPGLADMHAHIFHTLHGEQATGASARGSMLDTLRARRRLALWLANGVTTIRNMDYAYTNMSQWALILKAEAAAGSVPSPRIVTAGRWSGPAENETAMGPWPAPEEVAARLQTYKDAGFDFVKSYFEPKPVFDSLVAAAARLNMPIAGHIPPGTKLSRALKVLKSIEHPMAAWDPPLNSKTPDSAELRALTDTMKARGIWHTPTQSHYIALHEFPVANGTLKSLSQGGVGILLGTDEPPRSGIIARELVSLVTEGLTPYQALSTGTRNVAEYFGTLSDVGTITVGKRADLVLLSSNPLVDLQVAATPIGVMVGGRWYTKAAIDARVASLADK